VKHAPISQPGYEAYILGADGRSDQPTEDTYRHRFVLLWFIAHASGRRL